MNPTQTFQVSAFGCTIRASWSCAQGAEVLERYIFPGLPRDTEPRSETPDLSVSIEQRCGEFDLKAGGEILASAARAVDLAPDLIRALDEAVLRRLSGCYAVHAGVVQVGEAAVLLPGMTHAGKSSLVAALLGRGATYFSDEYALIDGRGRVHPYPRPLLMRNGTPLQTPKLAEEFGARTGDGPVRVGLILQISFRPETGWQLYPLPQSAGVLTLLQNTPCVLAESPALLGALQNAAAGARSCQGFRGDAAEAAEEILRLVEEQSQTSCFASSQCSCG